MNEERDAKTFADWGFDLLKYDNCAVPFDSDVRENIFGKFERMSSAIRKVADKSGQDPMIFSLCEWGRQEPWLWAKQFGQAWRVSVVIYERVERTCTGLTL